MNASSLLFQLGLSLAIGLLVGTERHWRERDDAPGSRTAGIRTFGIIGLLGGVTGAIGRLSEAPPTVLAGAVFIAFSGVFGLFKWRESEEHQAFSVTTVVAGQTTLMLGMLAGLDQPAAAGGAAIALTLLLASRETLHAFVKRLTWAELRSAIFLLAMAFIVLPLLPDRKMGPYEAINPAEIWIFAIALAGVSFAGYLAVRIFGSSRGPLIAGIAGGLVSSTAVALTSARDSIQAQTGIYAIAAGALAASAVSVIRGIVLVVILAPAMSGTLLPGLGAIAAVLTALALLCMWWGHTPHKEAPAGETTEGEAAAGKAPAQEQRNPFEFGAVLKLAAIIAFATISARVAAAVFGDNGIIIVSVIMGLVDIDSVILSVTRLSADTLGAGTLEWAILLAIATNIAAKAVYSLLLGSRYYGLLIAGVSLLSLIAGALVISVTLV